MTRNEDEKAAFLRDKIETGLGAEGQAKDAQRWPWLCSCATAVNVALFCSLALNAWLGLRPRFCNGAFPTDMKDARRSVHYETRTFTGALVFDPNKHALVRLNPEATEYFGPPGPAVDKAWGDLLHGQFPAMTDREAELFLPDPTLLTLDSGRYHSDPDVFHSLHCINALRSMLAGPLYGVNLSHMAGVGQESMRAHMDHCMDRLRQSVMCHGDLTPNPLHTYPGAAPIGKSGPHTCREWEPIRAWMDERGTKGPVYG